MAKFKGRKLKHGDIDRPPQRPIHAWRATVLDAMTQLDRRSAARAMGQESKEASMFLDQVWDGIKTGSLACLCAFGIYCMVVGAITTVDQLAAHITAGCEKGGQHGTE